MGEPTTARRRRVRMIAGLLAALLAVGLLELIGGIGLAFVEDVRPALPAELAGTVRMQNRSPDVTPDPFLLYRPEPGASGENYRTNAFGLRGRDVSREPAEDTLRVMIFGGSVAWGYCARNDDETPAGVLEEILATRVAEAHPALAGRRVEVLNAGVPGYVSWQEVLAYARGLRDLGPHAVVMLDGTNDVYSAIRRKTAGVPTRPARKLKSEPSLGAWLRYTARRMRIVGLAQALGSRRTLADYAPPPAEEIAAAYREALELLGDLAAVSGCVVLPVLQPMAVLPDTKELTEFEQECAAYFERSIPGQSAYFDTCFQALRRVHDALRKDRPDLDGLDATGVFRDESEDCFLDHCHLTPHGRRVLMDAIADALLDRLARKR